MTNELRQLLLRLAVYVAETDASSVQFRRIQDGGFIAIHYRQGIVDVDTELNGEQQSYTLPLDLIAPVDTIGPSPEEPDELEPTIRYALVGPNGELGRNRWSSLSAMIEELGPPRYGVTPVRELMQGNETTIDQLDIDELSRFGRLVQDYQQGSEGESE